MCFGFVKYFVSIQGCLGYVFSKRKLILEYGRMIIYFYF